MSVRLDRAKSAASASFPPGHPGREAILALQDEIPEREFDAIFPSLVRFLRVSPSVGGPFPADAGGSRRGGTADVRGDRDL